MGRRLVVLGFPIPLKNRPKCECETLVGRVRGFFREDDLISRLTPRVTAWAGLLTREIFSGALARIIHENVRSRRNSFDG